MKQGLIVNADGNKYWYKDGQLHREDGPAIEWLNGNKHWYVNGKPHREGGPAVEHTDGYKAWYVDGKRHRVDGPAVEEFGGDKHWYKNGKEHRGDGPAVEYADGDKYWYLHGKKLSEEEFNKLKLLSNANVNNDSEMYVTTHPEESNMENVLKMYKQQLDEIIREAESDGVVLTIELVSEKPLAMGNHRMVSDVREKRKTALSPMEMQKIIGKTLVDVGKGLSEDIKHRIADISQNHDVDMEQVRKEMEHIQTALNGGSVKEPPFKISKSSIDLFRKVYPGNPALRLGQAFHQYFKLEKITNPEAKVFADRIYNADEVETKDLIDYITDWSN